MNNLKIIFKLVTRNVSLSKFQTFLSPLQNRIKGY